MANLQRTFRVFCVTSGRGVRMKSRNLRQYSSDESAKKQSLFQKLMDSTSLSAHKNAHSKTLTSNVATYELQFDEVKPECMSEYIKETGAMHNKLNEDETYPGQLMGSWTTVFGEQDTAVHLWVYKDGYKGVTDQMKFWKENPEVNEFDRQKCNWVNSRSNQLCHEFSYWGEPRFRKKPHIYELRTYALKPGTLIEWGNRWGTAINIRRKDAVGGFFSQVGDLYMVHHLWAYYDMQHRKEERENMWQQPGWDDCVAATVPLIRHMKARILLPTPNSPMQ